MRFVFLFLVMLGAGVTYQNCGNQKFAVDQDQLKKVLPSEDTPTWTAVRFSGDTHELWTDIELETGKIYEGFEREGTRTEQDNEVACLTTAQLNDLQEILADSSICESTQNNNPGLACTMIYRFPYAALQASTKEGEKLTYLGEQTSGCHVPTDLCEQEKALALRQLLQEIRTQYPSQSCL